MKKKGFTLIELMAVITILAILSLIIIPIVDKNIKESKENMFNIQLDNIRMAGQNYFSDNPSLLPIKSNYAFVKLTKLIDKNYIGGDIKNPKTSKPFEEEIVVQVYNDSDNYKYSVCPFEEGCIDNDDVGDDLAGFVKVRDTNPGIICGDELEENYYSNNICHIRSVEDLVGFSYLVNNKFSFTNKTILVMYNLDIKNTNSYVDPNNIMFGDVNGDGIASSLMEELTDLNGIGYPSIGNSTNKFLGDLDGDGHIINNLYINRSSSNYVGLFGYNYGVIQDLTISNSVIKGKDYVGLIGYNNGAIKGVKHLDMNISGNNYVGGIVGYNSETATGNIASGKVNGNQYVAIGVGYNSSATFEAIVEGDVVSTSNYVGGLAGYVTYGKLSGVFRDGSVTASGSSYSNKVVGTYNNTTPGLVSLDTISVKIAGSDSSVQGTSLTSSHGYSISSESINNIAINDAALDTFVGGDNNGDGYYYDYNSEGKLDVFDIRDGHINITMEGRGTSEDPYIINNYNDLKQASTNLKASYRLNNDIDLKDKNPIIMGGYSHKFTGVFDGNGYSISNTKLVGYEYVGFFGYNNGTVRGLKLNNIDVFGSDYVGILAGYNSGKMTSNIVNGNVKGKNYVGLGVGNNSSATLEAIVSGNVLNSTNYVGGLAGYVTYGKISGIFRDGSVTSNGTSYINKTIGTYNNTTPGLISLDTIPLKIGSSNSSPQGTSLTSNHGYSVNSEDINNISLWDSCVDTIVGGDNNGDGYYFDYNSEGIMDIVSLYRNPIVVTMDGRGTSDDPYIITNYDELKQASTNLSLYYRLGADIDLSDKNPIFLGDYSNNFTGVFDGNGYSISNTKLVGYEYVGFFGYNNGTVRGLKLNNIDVHGSTYVGIAAGYNSGYITGMIVSGNVNGYEYVGLGAGYSSGSSSKVEVVASGDVYGKNGNTGGLVGRSSYSYTSGIFLSGTVTSNSSSYSNKSIGYYHNTNVSVAALDSIVFKYGNTVSTVTSTSLNSDIGYTATSDQLGNIAFWDVCVDTIVGGDNNKDGYYYDYNSDGKIDLISIYRNPIDITMDGRGTSNDPYIITNYDELKQASTNLSLHYRLNNDIDLSGKNPIFMGGYANTFTGVFDGNGYSISNTKLVGYNSVGFFGRNTGTVRGLKLNNIDSSGYSYVGSLTGYNTGNLTGNIVSGSASGYEYVAIGVGHNDNGIVNIAASGDVYSTNHGGIIAGLTSYGKLGGIVLSGSVTCSSSHCGRSFGRQIVSSSTNYTAVHESVTVNSNVRSTYDISDVDGYTTNSDGINSIALWDSSVDTVVGGDNNNDGYYFDYNSKGIMDIVSLYRNPIVITMSGSGTSEDPYIITNYDELKQASTNLSLYYRLGADIDLSDKNPIFLGGYANKFTGVFDGNGYSISNTKLVGYNSVGFFGYNNGTVRGLKLINIDSSGYKYVGSLTGYNNGNLTGNIVSGSASGYEYVAIGVGHNDNGIVNIAASGDVYSTNHGGIIAGLTSYGKLGGVVLSGSVTCSSSNCGRSFGRQIVSSSSSNYTAVHESVTVNSNVRSTYDISDVDGYTTNSDGINSIALWDSSVDTVVGGDNNDDGYYFDYNSEGIMDIVSLYRNPIVITMSGSGTSGDPYIINNYDELKQASTMVDKYYRLDADIDLSDEHPIMLGGFSNSFTGVFDGNGHSISNTKLVGYNSVGFFGHNRGTVKGIRLLGMDISGYNYIGVINGYNRGTIYDSFGSGNASGYSNIGLASGYTNGSVHAIVSGNVNASNSYGGGIIGYSNDTTVKGAFISGSVRCSSSCNRTFGRGVGGTITTIALDSILVNSSTVNSTSLTSYDGKGYSASEMLTSTPYESIGFNFTVTDPNQKEYIWYFDNNNLLLRKN